MKIEFKLIDDTGKSYCGSAELSASQVRPHIDQAQIRAGGEPNTRGLPAQILALREEDFFREPRTPAEVHERLSVNYSCLPNRVQMALLRLHRKRELRKTVKKTGDREQPAFVW